MTNSFVKNLLTKSFEENKYPKIRYGYNQGIELRLNRPDSSKLF